MINSTSYKSNKGIGEIMTLKEAARYKMARKRKIPAMKIEIGKNDKVIIRIPYNQKIIKKIRMISGRRGIPNEN